MRWPRWFLVMMGRRGIGHSPSVHTSGGTAGECKACPRDRQPTWPPRRTICEAKCTPPDHVIGCKHHIPTHTFPPIKFDRWS